jgi:hypothetical protein
MMSNQLYSDLEKFLDILGLNEELVGIFYTDDEPTDVFLLNLYHFLPVKEK